MLVVPSGPTVAGMTDYCQVPPYVIQNIPPNVLILLDISGSMLNLAYRDGYQTPTNTADDRSCTSADPCMEYNWTGRPASHRYYGYFDPDQWYTYASGVFTAAGPRSGAKQSSYWSGDFLNWLTMRRIDVMRKVLTGGRPNGTKIDGQPADDAVRGLYKRITKAEALAYTPFTTTGNKDVIFVFDTGNSGTSKFDAYSSQNTDTTNNTYSSADKITSQVVNQSIAVNVTVPLPVEGVLQTVVGARARVGLLFYNTNDGGKVITDVGKDVAGKSSLTDTINQINLSSPNTNTPLAEALWSATGYFAQQSTISGYDSPNGTDPSYHSADYGTTNNSDPMNFGTGGTPRWPVCQKNFVLLLTDGEPCSDGKIPTNIRDYPVGRSPFQCVVGTNYQSCPATSGTGWSFPASSLVNSLCSGTGVKSTHGDESGIEDVALYMHTKDLRNSPAIGPNNTNDITGFQNLTLYTVFAFGNGSTLLKYAAINGGFENSGPTEMPSTGSPSNWDKNGDGVPDTYFEATEGAELEQAVKDAFSGILKRASSGTAASVLASGEGSGANLIQAVFYPRRAVGNDVIWWTGALQNMWYFVDPFFANATIREDTTHDEVLNLANDDIVQFYFDPVSQLTQVRRWHSDDNGHATTQDTTLSFENINSLWEAGKKLWQRNLSSSSRKIYTNNIGGVLDNSTTMTQFSVGNATQLAPYMLEAGDNVTKTINYVHGIDNTDDLDLRSRTVTFGSDNNVWKLGDVVNSTPRIVASVPLNKYDTVYSDTTYKTFISDNNAYLKRGMVFTGGNDGMLHAFRLGKLELSWTGKTLVQKARITNPYSGTTLGDEAWAYIPKNALPYLKYLKDPDYCHLYYADLAPYVFDASINGLTTDTRTSDSWRTVVIGGMRTGGACDNSAGCTTANNCVKTPEGGATGYSSYFALDVTDPLNPSLLWEFANPGLGFATTGPAVIRINAVNTSTSSRDRTLNGEWYVVFGSGPTGPIDSTNNQFLGRSNQDLKFFVLNLKTGTLVQTIDTNIHYAFAGSMINSVADFNLDYQDDLIYVGYVKRAGTSGNYTWTDGGVGRILTANTTPTNASGGSWKWSPVIDGIGPVTSSVARLQNNNYGTNWLFFGTGRYFFENPPTGTNTTPDIDDPTNQRRLFGLKDPCFISHFISPTCTSSVTFSTSDSTFPNVTSIASVPAESVANSSGFKGWYIDLDPSANYSYDNTAARLFRSERVITDPLATTSGVVFFTTYKPYGDECALGGKSFLWALRYNSGGVASSAVMKGKALVQVSTASVEQLDLGTAFKMASGEGAGGLHKDGRRTGAIEGVPPTSQGLSLLSQPPPVKRIMHMMER
jgi:type IV pilus assembly protein PilY1